MKSGIGALGSPTWKKAELDFGSLITQEKDIK